jgi:ATP adenylyltransferase
MTTKNLWAPWRSQYVSAPKEEGCVFCNALKEANNPERGIIITGEHAFIIMNRFPYSTGHLMVVPKEHIGGLEELDPKVVSEMWALLKEAKRALHCLYAPDGFNVGLNIGTAAGAGIADHLHIHLVPRWEGDTNFMPIMADVRLIPQHMEEIYKALKGEITL